MTEQQTTAPRADLSEAARLLAAGFKLCELMPMQKRPALNGWNVAAAETVTEGATGYGLMLELNGLCSVDPDNGPLAAVGLAATDAGCSLDELLAAGVRTSSTRPGSGGRSAFKTAPGLAWIKFAGAPVGSVLELRAGSGNLQDAVPGLLYEGPAGAVYTQHYANGRKLDDAQPLPAQAQAWWQRMSADADYCNAQFAKFFAAIEAKTGQQIKWHRKFSSGDALAFPFKYRAQFLARVGMPEILERHGYTYHERLRRWARPGAQSNPGVRKIEPDNDSNTLWKSDHGECPLGQLPHFDAWVAHVILDHAGDAAAAAAAFMAANPHAETGGLIIAPAVSSGAATQQVIDAHEGWEAQLLNAADVRAAAVDWLWPSYFAVGKLNIMQGLGGVSKSALSCELAAIVTARDSWPDGAEVKAGGVLLWNIEDDAADTIKPRLLAAGADCSRVDILTGLLCNAATQQERMMTVQDIDALDRLLTKRPGHYRLICIDPITAVLGQGVNSNSDAEVRAALNPLGLLAEKHSVAIVFVAHMNKSEGRTAAARVLGSIGFYNMVRAGITVTEDPDHPPKSGHCTFARLKSSNAAQTEVQGCKYQLTNWTGPNGESAPRFVWKDDPETRSADELVNAQRPEPAERADEQQMAAEGWLLQRLQAGEVRRQDLRAEIEESGQPCSWRTMLRAIDGLGGRIRARHIGREKVYFLPPVQQLGSTESSGGSDAQG